MIPPTSIDGTDITGATIDGTDVQEITVDGQTVFSAAPDVLIVDDFESQNLNNWTGDVSQFATTTSNVKFGNAALTCPGNTRSQIFSTGVETTPQPGDTQSVWFQTGGTFVLFKYASDGTDDNEYRFYYNPDNGNLSFIKIVDGNFTNLRTAGNNNLDSDEYYRLELTHEANGSVDFRCFDDLGNETHSLTTSDTSHITNGQFDNNQVSIDMRSPQSRADQWVVLR